MNRFHNQSSLLVCATNICANCDLSHFFSVKNMHILQFFQFGNRNCKNDNKNGDVLKINGTISNGF